MLRIAAAHEMTIMLNVLETSGWLDTSKVNGPEKAAAYGRYLGDRYKDVPNIIWMYGNDFQTWEDPTDDSVVLAVAKGIRSADRNHIHTTELNYLTSGSLDDARWEALVELDGAYTYYPTYAQVLKEYSRSNFKPVFMVEANYEFEYLNTDGGSLPNLRHQEYWTMLSGATGQLYGSAYTWRLPSGWLSNWRLKLSARRLFGWRSNLDVAKMARARPRPNAHRSHRRLRYTGSLWHRFGHDRHLRDGGANSGRDINHRIHAHDSDNNHRHVETFRTVSGPLV
jgi:hypothetical protein